MSEWTEFDLRDRTAFYFHATPLRRATVWLAALMFKPLMILEVRGLEHLAADGALILASNHVSNFDVFAMQLAMPRPIFFMGKAELFRFTLLGMLLRNLGAFPVYRGEKDAWALMHARKVLDAGQVLGMFPEGTRSKGRGLGIAKTGTARLAIEAGCPVLPTVITGTDHFFRRFPRRTRVCVAFLAPIHARRGEDPLSLTDRLMLTIAAALPERMRGPYAAKPGLR